MPGIDSEEEGCAISAGMWLYERESALAYEALAIFVVQFIGIDVP